MINNVPSKRLLHFSLLWFGISAAVWSLLYAWYRWPDWGMVAFAEVPVTILSSLFFWWDFVVHPKGVTTVRGILAGIVSIICAFTVFEMWVSREQFLAAIQKTASVDILHLLMIEQVAIGFVTFGLVPAFLVGLTWGWIMGIAGGLLTWYLRHNALPKANIDQQTQEPVQQSSQMVN